MIAPYPLAADSKLVARDGANVIFFTPSYSLHTPSRGTTEYHGRHITPYIDPSKRLSMFLAGPPGAGKSYFIARMIEQLADQACPIYLFTSIGGDDEQFTTFAHRIRRVRMNAENVRGVDLKRLRTTNNPGKDAILIFDDVDKIREADLRREIFKLMEDTLANGRAHGEDEGNLHIFITSHALNDYRLTKYSFENSDYAVIFPSSTPFSQVERFLIKLGVKKDVIRRITSSGQRTCLIHKILPMFFVLGSTYFSLIN